MQMATAEVTSGGVLSGESSVNANSKSFANAVAKTLEAGIDIEEEMLALAWHVNGNKIKGKPGEKEKLRRSTMVYTARQCDTKRGEGLNRRDIEAELKKVKRVNGFPRITKDGKLEVYFDTENDARRDTAGAGLPPYWIQPEEPVRNRGICAVLTSSAELSANESRTYQVDLLGQKSNLDRQNAYSAVSDSTQLVPDSAKPKPLNLELCFICQRVKDSKGSSQLTSTDDGRQTIINTSEKLQDGLVDRIEHTQWTSIKYHLKSCYSAYRQKGNRHVAETPKRKAEEEDIVSPLTSPKTRAKRSKLIKSPEVKDKPCVICDHVKCKGETQRFRIENPDVAGRLLKAANFNKDAVHTRVIFMKEIGDVFAIDVMYHAHCMNKYIQKFQRDVEKLMAMNFENQDQTNQVQEAFEELTATLNICTNGYAVSDLRDALNEKLEVHGVSVTNRRLKTMLIDHFEDTVCFTYPKDKRKSQMFNSVTIACADVAENLRATDSIKECAEKLRDECKQYLFELDGTYELAEDCDISYDTYTKNRPESWVKFFNILFPHRPQSFPIQRKCDTIFQICHYVMHNGKQHTPLHVSLAELLHDDSRAKLVINVLNRLGLSISYDELQRTDAGIVEQILETAGPNRVPVSLPHNEDDDEAELHGAMDNFDHEEATSSGIGGSHDTILMLFQNNSKSDSSPRVFSQKPSRTSEKPRSLPGTLPCQELVKMGTFCGRGKLPSTFSPGDEADLSWKENDLAKQHRLWTLARYHDNCSAENEPHVPSFAAVKSLLDSSISSVTCCAFTPILPYPATEYDTIFSIMINFQDVLRQRGRENGPLWSDEGVYHIAKEIQLLHPQKFENIFLGIGGFHLEKVVIGCLGSYLESSGIQHLLVEEKVYGPAVVNSVMSGGNYIRGKRCMSLIAETMEQLQISSFLESSDGEMYSELFQKINNLTNSMKADPAKNLATFTGMWSDCLAELDKFEEDFDAFKVRGSAESNLFAYWNNFIDNLAPVLRDLTRSFREADWYLHLSSVNRAIDLCFSFDRINYKRWLTIYYEDCLALRQRFPKMFNSFLKGDFVVRHTSRKGSAVPLDQALEKAYNKPAKSSSGIIGFSRRKEAVCKWNLIKHEKGKYRNFLYDVCQMSDDDEYSLHHEFSEKITEADKASVKAMIQNIAQRGNPFDIEHAQRIMNIATGAILEKDDEEFLLNCKTLGKTARNQFYQLRLEQKTEQLLDKIPKTRKTTKKKTKKMMSDLNKEAINFLRHVDYGRLRGFDMKVLLSYEISATSFYLTKDGEMRKSNKSELATELKSMLHEKAPACLPPTLHQRVIIIDFMAYARKVPIKKQKLKTFSDLFSSLWDTFASLAMSCNIIDVVFYVYMDLCVKASERKRRATVEGIETVILTIDQTLPVEMDRFWSLSQNKTALQQNFITWALNKAEADNFDKKLYLGGSHKDNSDLCYSFFNGSVQEERLLECTHEEADDRMLFHANHAVKVGNYKSVVIASADTDIFVSATHHFLHFKSHDLKELWFVSGRSDSRTFFPVHDLSNHLDSDFIRVLVPIHDLTGSDSISKVGTKTKAAREGLENFELLSGFGQEAMTDEMIDDAERFLLKCVTKHDVKTFDELRYVVYHEKHLEFNIERFPPTSDSIRQHILRAYLQCYKRLQSPFLDNIGLDPRDYGYRIDAEDNLVPIISTKPSIPSNFPHPCTCQKCSRANVCKC